jgi:glycosyltransferase involved in cell wall biosynthesis
MRIEPDGLKAGMTNAEAPRFIAGSGPGLTPGAASPAPTGEESTPVAGGAMSGSEKTAAVEEGKQTAPVTAPVAEQPMGGVARGRVTAIVPARNEELVIATCVRALARQADVAEILVVDDESGDGTAGVVRTLMAEIPQLRLLEARGLPAGWLGKNNAAWRGAGEGTNPWLLFTDADAELLPGATARALEIAGELDAALVSFSPEQVTEAWYEKALIPFVFCRLARRFSFQDVNDPASHAAAANGQFLMIRRDVYDAIGGHGSVAGEVLEDVALARNAKVAGYRIWFGAGKGVARARMYRSFGAMCEGWKKNLYLLVGGSRGAVVREFFSAVPWIPFLLIAIGLRMPFALMAGVILLLVRQAGYGLELRSNQFRGSLILYYVPAVVLYAGVLWASYRAHVKGKVAWKGRVISVGVPGGIR